MSPIASGPPPRGAPLPESGSGPAGRPAPASEAELVRFAQELVRDASLPCGIDAFTQRLATRLRAEGLATDSRALARWLLALRRACVVEILDGQ